MEQSDISHKAEFDPSTTLPFSYSKHKVVEG